MRIHARRPPRKEERRGRRRNSDEDLSHYRGKSNSEAEKAFRFVDHRPPIRIRDGAPIRSQDCKLHEETQELELFANQNPPREPHWKNKTVHGTHLLPLRFDSTRRLLPPARPERTKSPATSTRFQLRISQISSNRLSLWHHILVRFAELQARPIVQRHASSRLEIAG